MYMNIAFVLRVTVRKFDTQTKNYLMKRGKTMKKLTKTFLSVAAVSALTAAMAASASAMTAAYVPGADGAVNTVTLTDVANSGASQTMIILNQDAQVVESTMVEAIDQKDDSTVFTSVPVNALDDGTYYVRIGGTDGSMQRATFTVGQVAETETITIGDVNGNTTIESADGTALARYNAKFENGIGNVGVVRTKSDNSGTVLIGDVNGNTTIESADGTALARYNAKFENGIGNVGQTVEVIK